MMNINISVNGRTISYVEIVNMSPAATKNDLCDYVVKVQDSENPEETHVDVKHRRSDGYLILLMKAFTELVRKK